MRLRVILLLVAALLFKGWAGEAMAGQMIAQQLEQTAAHAMPVDCPGHAAHEDGTMNPASCEQCQACSLHALPALPIVVGGEPPQATPRHEAIRFASAEPRASRKPPVS